MPRSEAGVDELASPLRHRPFLLMLLAAAAAFSGYGLLLPVVPLWAVRQGAGALVAGAATGVFMASTVVVQFAVPAFAAARGYRSGLVWGALLLGVPSPLFLVATNAPPILAISLVRGAGFGLLTVCASALIAELLPGRLVARGSGLYGLAVGLPQLLGLPLGTAIAETWGFAPVFGLAATLPLCAVVPMLGMPPAFPRHDPGGRGGFAGAVAATWRPWLPMLAVSTGFGSLATFLPMALPTSAAAVALFVVPGTSMLARWVAGLVGHRMPGPGRMLVGALMLGGLGLLGFALAPHPVLAVVAVAVFGIGFGIVQNDALVAMFARTRAGTASVAWNVAFDAGQGLGAVAVGAVVSGASFAVAFSLLAGWAFALLPVAWLAGRSPSRPGN